MDRNQHLQEIEGQYRLMRDRLRGVVGGHTNGVYLFGPPGISKTYTVANFLKDNSVAFEHVLGHLTGSGLFDVLEKNPQGVIVLDDVSNLFRKDDKGVQLLLAALGSPPNGSRVRTVTYGTARGERVVEFTGGIIAISNLGLDEHRNDVIRALADRVNVLKFDPTPEQVEALIHKIAMTGPAGVTAEDAVMVAEFLADECRKHGTRLTIRLFIDKALPDFRIWKAEGTENHWQDLVRANLAGGFVPQRHAVREMPRSNPTDADGRRVPTTFSKFLTPMERVRAWKARNGAANEGSGN
jgi:hypothetical protein